MDENKKNEIFQNQENGQINGSEKPKEPSDNINIPQSTEQKESNIKEEDNKKIEDKNEQLSILKDIDLIQGIKNNNYEEYINKGNFVDFRTKDNKPWKIGLVVDVLDDVYIIEDIKEDKKEQIRKDDSKKIAYFRKYTTLDSDENFYLKRESKEQLLKRLIYLEKMTSDENNNIFNQKIWDIYYILHSKFFFGLDAAMKVNITKKKYYSFYGGYDDNDENEGIEESFRIILCILLFLSKYYKYIGENIEEFLYYQKKIINTELEDLKIINKKCAFFSFFEESLDLLNKITGNVRYCLDWYITFDKELKSIIPIIKDNQNENNYPYYEIDEKEDTNLIDSEGIKLKKICLKNAYNYETTFTTEKVKIKAIYVAYFIDYFNAINGISNLAQLLYKSKSIDFAYFQELSQKFIFAKILTGSYSETLFEEKKHIYEFFDNFIENSDDVKTEQITYITNMFFKGTPKIKDNLNFHLISKKIFSSKKLEEKINSLTKLNKILEEIAKKDSNLSIQDFCENCKKYKILNILYDKNVHEEIIKRLPDIIYIMYENNFGYEKNEENKEKINSDKKLIFDVLFEKLLESEQNNEKLVKNIQNIICDFCQILDEEDKLNVYNNILNYIDKSIEKKGIPMKEHLSFIIDYSLKAIETKYDNKKENKDDDADDDEDEEEEEDMENEEKKEKIAKNENKNIEQKKENKDNAEIKGEVKNGGDNDSYDENLINSNIEKNNYYGLNLLIQYLSEEKYNKYSMTNEQKIDIINISITGIIKLIQACDSLNQTLLIKNICSKTSSSIQNTKDIVQYLLLLDKMKSDNKLCVNFSHLLEEYSLKSNFFSMLITDMDRYISLIIKNSEEKSNEKDNIKVFEGLFNNEVNIKLRLNLIFFLLKNQQNISKENLIDFNTKIIKGSEKNKLVSDLVNNLLYSNLKNFSSNVTQFLYDNVLTSEITDEKLSDYQYYIFCTAIIKEINKLEKHFYFMNDKDLAVINCETEQNIKGINLLWDFLIKTKNDNIRNKVNEFLADIFYGIKLDTREKLENFWTDFVSNIYSKLEEIIQKENNDDSNDAKDKMKYSLSIQGIISLIKKIENKFTNKGEIIKDINQISKEVEYNRELFFEKKEEEEKYIKIFFSGKRYKTDTTLDFDLKIGSSEYFYMFRYKLSQFYKIPVNLIYIIIDDVKYNNKLKSREEFNNIKFDMYNDLQNSYNAFTDLERKINLALNNNIENPLILKVEVKKENDYFKFIKKLIKDYPKLMHLLKRKHSECLLDVWCLIREEEIKINNEIIQIIKDIFNNKNEDNIDNIFNFNETNIYYISYILFHLNNVINEYNNLNENFINDVFLQSKIWPIIRDIKIETSNSVHLGEIYEKNNIINYLLCIFKNVSMKTNDEAILVFILNKIFEFYYQTINDCNNINLKLLPPTEGFQTNLVEDLYISNTNIIKDIITKNQFIYKKFLELLLNKDDKDNQIKIKFEYLFLEGLLKNRIYSLNLKLQSFIITILDDNFFSIQDNTLLNEFYVYIINYFFSREKYDKLITYIREIALNGNIDSCFNVDKYEKNIELYFDIVTGIVDKIYPIVSSFYSFEGYIKKIIIPNIYNPIIKDIPNDSSYHEIILGGNLKILLNLLSKAKNYKDILDLKKEEEDKLKHYLFSEIILNKCNKRIFTKENIINYNSISISSPYTFKNSINIFVFLIMQTIHNEKEENINYYFDKITELHKECYWKGNSILDWKLEYKDNIKLSPFVGLKNLGCTCYMNSLLQVFYNFLPFRESILKCPCKEEKKNSLYQIKKVFYSLKYLQVNYYTPSDFPQNFDDEILNVHLQMDVDEFFGNILDKIENRLKKTKNENLVKYFFQGSQNDILTFQDGCTHHRTNVNDFYSIQLQVQNKKNIYESLDTLTEGELMNGDNCIFCPKCNKKIAAVKSQKFKTLPRMLIFVLKRFEFDYDTLKKVKINDYYEFPQELDMTKYLMDTSNGKNEKENNDMNKFILKSVVVHMGNTEQGHYYAFIRKEGDKWYQFNDTEVTPFDINLLEEETFGGEEIFYSDGNKKTSQKNRSAYLLFYEKKNQSDCQEFDNIEAINLFLNNGKNIINENINKNEENNINNEENNIINNGQESNNENVMVKNKEENEINTTMDNSEIKEEKENKEDKNNDNDMKEILENLNNEMFKYFLNKKLFSSEYQYFILELFCNILNYYYCYDLPVFVLHLCRNNASNNEMLREIQAINSNINHYIKKNEIILFSKTSISKNKDKADSRIILNIFKYFIIYFFNVFIRMKDKEYLGCMVDLMKFFINDQVECSDYLIEEFCNKNIIIEYLMNCPSYEIKKLIVGILYCAMIKSVNGYELIKIEKNKKIYANQYTNSKKLSKTQQQSLEEDEKLARRMAGMEETGKTIYENPLDYEGIPPNMLKMIYNILHLIRLVGFNHLNEQRFLYFIIYRFSLINQNTKEFLIYKCRVFELLCLLLERSCATKNYPTKDILSSIDIGLYTVSHCILGKIKNEDEGIISDKGGIYRNENYVFMLFFNLLNSNLTNKKNGFVEDQGYSLDNSEFVKILLNNIRTKQDAFCFSNYINERCANNKYRINNVMEALINYLNRVDNNENVTYEYNNYQNFSDNDLNANVVASDPGMNPKYLLMIIKRFLINQNLKQDYVIKFIKYIFKIFDNNKNYYNYSIMIIDFVSELFSIYLSKYIPQFQKDISYLTEWLRAYPISPKIYKIEDLSLYKYQRKTYADDLDEKTIKEFEANQLLLANKKIEILVSIYNCNPKNEMKYEKDLDLSDFRFIIGDVIYYGEEEAIIVEALDEMIKIKINNNKDKKGNTKKEIWVETDSDKIRIKELNSGNLK